MQRALLGLSESHDKLSALLEDEDAENDDIREAAITVCAALNGFWQAIEAKIVEAAE